MKAKQVAAVPQHVLPESKHTLDTELLNNGIVQFDLRERELFAQLVSLSMMRFSRSASDLGRFMSESA